MPWFTRRLTPKAPSDRRRAYRQSVELPIAVQVDGIPAPVYGTLINVSVAGARFRSLILLDRQHRVEFEFKRAALEPLRLRGRIVTRSMPTPGGGFQYGVTFDGLTDRSRDELAREIAELQHREAAARAQARENGAAHDASLTQRRGSVRVPIVMPVNYRRPGAIWTAAQATDISTAGLRLACREALNNNESLELRFTLPSEVLAVFPAAGLRTEISPFGSRTVKLPDSRRPFAPMTVRGRIVARFTLARARDVYGMQFIDIDGYQQEDIARFIHASHLHHIRNV